MTSDRFDEEPLDALRENLAITIAEALTDDEAEDVTLKELGDYIADKILDGSVIHTDVCPQCHTPMTYHPLDPPPLHPCAVERECWVPAAFVGEVR